MNDETPDEKEIREVEEGFSKEDEEQLEGFEGEFQEVGRTIDNQEDNGVPHQWNEERKCVKESYKISNFAEHLLKICKQYRTFREQRFKEFFKCEQKDLNCITVEYGTFQRTQAIVANNNFIAQAFLNGDIIGATKAEYYDDSDEVSPTYETIRTSRTKFEVFLTMGYRFLEYKKKHIVQDLYFSGSCRYLRLHFNKNDIEIAQDFLAGIRTYMKENNIFKGEKLLFSCGGYLEFLEFPKMGWDEVVLSPKIKEEFNLNLLTPLKNEELCKKLGVPWRRGLMLGGLAGTGKTQVCRILCNELYGTTVIWATPKAVQNEDDIAMLFSAARYFAPTLLVIEDIDFIGSSRDFGQDPSLGELLTQLDGNDPNHGIFVIATTNRPEMLDSALANRPSRFDVLIEFKLPELQSRKELIKLFSKNMMTLAGRELEDLASYMKDLTGAQIKEAFVYAQLKAIESGKPISLDDVRKRSEAYKPRSNAEAYRE